MSTTVYDLHNNAVGEETRLRFWQKVQKEADCWFWLGGASDGVPMFRVSGTMMAQAHKFSWMLVNNQSYPYGKVLRPVCNNRMCVNPAHWQDKPAVVKKCVTCKKEFPARHVIKKYCDDCSPATRQFNNRFAKIERVCPTCSKTFDARSKGRTKVYCSKECAPVRVRESKGPQCSRCWTSLKESGPLCRRCAIVIAARRRVAATEQGGGK